MSVAKQAAQDAQQMTGKAVVSQVKKLVKLSQQMERKVGGLEDRLKEAKEEHRKLIEDELPDVMKKAGLQEFTTDDGMKVVLKIDTFASISKVNKEAALVWLRKYNYDDLIKATTTIRFDRGQDAIREKVEASCVKNKLEFEQAEQVHGQSLKAFIKSVLDERSTAKKPGLKRLNPPEKLFGIFVKTVAKITSSKGD